MPDQTHTTSDKLSAAPALRPVPVAERIEVIDLLRGFALFGVLLINMRNFDLPPGHVWMGTVDQVAAWLTLAFGAGKFWRLFSFLFGLGFALQLERAQARDVPFLRVYLRRLGVLLVFGALHKLIYDGDILFPYALSGLLLLLFYRCSSRTILLVACALFLFPVVQFALDLRSRELARDNPEAARLAATEAAQRDLERAAGRERYIRLVTSAGFGEYVSAYGRHFARAYASWDAYEEIVADFHIFLLGLYIARRRVFQDLRSHLPLIRKVLRWGMIWGLAGTFVSLAGQWPTPRSPYNESTRNLAGILWFIGLPALSFAYAAAIILLAQKEWWRKRFAPLAALGRMALTNYLLQSVVFITMFMGWGLGLYGKIGPALNVLVTVLIYSFNVALSVWWLERYRFGPMEWLWRTLTYGKLQPMRLQPTAILAKVDV